MKIVVEYPTKEKKMLGEGVFTDIYGMAALEPIKILRRERCRNGKALNRYNYEGIFYAPDDCNEDAIDVAEDGTKTMRCAIERAINPKFKPLKLNFENNACTKFD